MKTIRAKGFGFAIHSGLLDIGRNYMQDIWAIELRWRYPLLTAWSFRLWEGKQKPTKIRIAICTALSPMWMLCHWLIAVPPFALLHVVAFAVALLIVVLSGVLSWLGDKLAKIVKL